MHDPFRIRQGGKNKVMSGGLYNAIFGTNPIGHGILKLLNLDESKVGRFRDVYIDIEANGNPSIAVYTRNGGGNRECYEKPPLREGCSCTGCTISYILPKHPRYIRDEDDKFDNTYATIWFSVPEEYKDLFLDIANKNDRTPRGERFMKLISRIQTATEEDIQNDPLLSQAIDVGKDLLNKMTDILEEDESNDRKNKASGEAES